MRQPAGNSADRLIALTVSPTPMNVVPVWETGKFYVKGSPDRARTIQEIA